VVDAGEALAPVRPADGRSSGRSYSQPSAVRLADRAAHVADTDDHRQAADHLHRSLDGAVAALSSALRDAGRSLEVRLVTRPSRCPTLATTWSSES